MKRYFLLLTAVALCLSPMTQAQERAQSQTQAQAQERAQSKQKPFAIDSSSREKSLAAYCTSLLGNPAERAQLAEGQRAQLLELTVADSLRRAVVIYPSDNSKPAPLVFVYHGRRGLISKAIKNMAIYRYWPEAIVVYSQGLWIEGGKMEWGTGWRMPNRNRDGRDIRLFDAQLEYLSQHFNIDSSRIFAMGHSNGGGMTYGLWGVRGDKLAGVCISCSGANPEGWLSKQRKPKPVFFLRAEDDALVDPVKYDSLICYTIDSQTTGEGVDVLTGATGVTGATGAAGVAGVAGVAGATGVVETAGATGVAETAGVTMQPAEGVKVTTQPAEGTIKYYKASPGGAPLVRYDYPGRHRFNPSVLPYLVEFFKGL